MGGYLKSKDYTNLDLSFLILQNLPFTDQRPAWTAWRVKEVYSQVQQFLLLFLLLLPLLLIIIITGIINRSTAGLG